MRDWLLADVADRFVARRLARRLLGFMLRAGWSVSRVYGISFDGGFTTTAVLTRDGRELRLSVDADRWSEFADGFVLVGAAVKP